MFGVLNGISRDVWGAVRRLLQTPVLSALAILTVALGVGANTSLFSVLNAVALRPLQVADPDRLVAVFRVDPNGQAKWMPLATATALGGHRRSLDSWCGYAGGALFAADVRGSFASSVMEFMTGSCFALLGAKPAVGRLLSPSDVPATGAPAPVAVIGYGFWQRAFDGDPQVVGQMIRVEGVPLTIIGVTANGFTGLLGSRPPDITVPATLLPAFLGSPVVQVSHLIGRLRPGSSLQQARTEFEQLWPAVREATAPNAGNAAARSAFLSHRLEVDAARKGFFYDRDKHAALLYRLLAFSGALLVLACANLSGFLLARTASRSHEFAVRRALGASRARLIRDCLVESLLLAAAGTTLAVPLTYATSAWLGRMLLGGRPTPGLHFAPDLRVLVVTATAALLVGLAIGTLSARSAARTRIVTVLSQAHSTSRGTGRLGACLVVPQVALAVVLLFGSGLVTRSLFNLGAVDVGFRTGDTLLAPLAAQPQAPSRLPSPETYYPALLQELSALPGVQAVGLARLFPRMVDETTILQPARTSPDGAQVQAAEDVVSPGLFDAAGIRLAAGRDFTWLDGSNTAPVAIVNTALARRLFPGGDAVGRRVTMGSEERRHEFEVVGVVNDTTMGNLRRTHVPMVFRPVLQAASSARFSAVVVRTRPGAMSTSVASAVRASVRTRGMDYVDTVLSAREQLDGALSRDRLTAQLSAAFAVLAMLVAFLGLQGLLAYTVLQRSREFGIRMSLGATRGCVLRMVLGRSLVLTTSGLLIGVPCALGAGRLAETMLFGLGPSDPTTLVATTVAILVIGASAGLLPARRAASRAPSLILREG